MILNHWLVEATQQLQQSGSDSPKLDAELLLCFVLQRTRAWLYGFDDYPLNINEVQQLSNVLTRRLQGEPMAYITGQRDFWTLTLNTHSSTLIPRPDTETLVEWALTLALPQAAKVLDLGTGTGAIALALASERSDWQVQGVDYQIAAVQLAKENAAINQLTHVQFKQSDWFSEVAGVFDLIVSNPPYIDGQDWHLNQGDVRFEPRSALVAEEAGIADLRHIVHSAPQYLAAEGWLLLEHGYQQAQAVRELLMNHGFKQIETRLDLGGNPRITGGQR